MAADTLKSLSITNLDAVPVVPNSTGEGAVGYNREVSDYVVPTAVGLADTGSKYKLLRLPTVAKLKALRLNLEAAIETSTGLVIDVGAYYSDATSDGTAAGNQGTAISVSCFLAASTGLQSSAVTVDALAGYKPSLRNQPLWQGLGLASDPGGFIDVVLAVHTAASAAVSKQVGAQASYVV